MHSPGAASRSPIGADALLVAAHARCVAATLVTNNEAKLGRVPGPKMERWLAGVAEWGRRAAVTLEARALAQGIAATILTPGSKE